jgi:gamma-glutamyltranspeptidase/glutathione hydrolase
MVGHELVGATRRTRLTRLTRPGRLTRPTRSRTAPASLVALLAIACGGTADSPLADAARPLGRIAVSADGMVVSGSEPATRVGAQVLAAGGNAVDAAVATAFALAVTEPTQSGLGGRTQALVWRPDGPPLGVDGTNEAPASYDPDTAEQVDDGYGVVAIPGTVAALAELHARAGSLPLARLVAPAIALARHGFPLSEGEARRLDGIRDRLLLSPAARSVFIAPDGTPYAPGDTLRQPDLAEVLEAVAEYGSTVFYEGWVAERMAEDFADHGGYVTAADLANFEAETSIVVEGRFGDLGLLGTYIPASGATSIEALQILDRVGLGEMDPGRRAFTVGRALEMAFADRETAWSDPRPPELDAAWIVSPELATERARALTGEADGASSSAGTLTGHDLAAAGSRGRTRPAPAESSNTTHVSVVDGRGMAVAMTQSLGPTGGSRVATEGLGFLYAATIGGYLGYVEPGDRPWSSQSPLIALRNGEPAYVMGGAGARRIISALVHTIVRIETEGMSPEEAIAAPRLHPAASAWRFEQLAGTDADPPGAAPTRAAGHRVRILPHLDYYFARLNVITIDRTTGAITGLADPRWAWGAASGPGGS